MTLRPVAEFKSGFHDDTVADEDEILVWPGRNIAEFLKEQLENLDYRVSEPIHAHERGWELDVWRGRKRLWLQVSVLDAEECYLTTANKTSWLWPDRKLFRAFLSDLQQILKADHRFSLVGWHPWGGPKRNLAPAAEPFDA